MQRSLLTCFLFLSLAGAHHASAQKLTRLNGTKITADSLRANIASLVSKAKVSGIQVAVFNRNKVVFQEAFGTSNSTKNTPLKADANIYGASLSKAVFAVLVMKLVEDGTLDLDKPLQGYLPKPVYEYAPQKKWQDDYSSLRTDTNYRKITARMCLNHTSGFPNWRWDMPDQKLKTMREPGTRYSYSGEGMVYLQTVIERLLNKSLGQLMQDRVFGPFGMKNSAYTFLPRFESSYILGHDAKGRPLEKDKDNEERAPSTLETTMDDYVRFTLQVMQGKALKPQSREEMFKPQIRLKSIAQFGPMAQKDNDANNNISLSYGLGWGLLKSPYGWGAFKEGHGDGFQHYTILFPESGTGILIMSNSDNGESIFKELLEVAIGDTYTPWRWQNYVPYGGG